MSYDTSMPVLCPNPCVERWIIHPLFGTYIVNGLARTRDSPMLERIQIDGCLKCPDEMIDTWVSPQWIRPSKPWWPMCPKTWDEHHDAWVVFLETELTMRCDVVVLHTIEHAHASDMWLNKLGFNTSDVQLTKKKISPKVRQSHKVGQKTYHECVMIMISHSWKSTTITQVIQIMKEFYAKKLRELIEK